MTVTLRLRDRAAFAAHIRTHFSTQRRFAAYLCVSATMVNNLVRGRRETTSMRHAHAMETALYLQPGTLFVLDGRQREVIAAYLAAPADQDAWPAEPATSDEPTIEAVAA